MHSNERRVCYFKGLIFALLFCVWHGSLKLLQYKLAMQVFHHGSTHPHQCSSLAVPPTPVFQHGGTTYTSVPAWQYPPTPVFQHGRKPPTPVFQHGSTTHTSVPAWQYHPHLCSSMVSYIHTSVSPWRHSHVFVHIVCLSCLFGFFLLKSATNLKASGFFHCHYDIVRQTFYWWLDNLYFTPI